MLIFSHLCRFIAAIGLLFGAFVIFVGFTNYRIIDQAIATAEAHRNFDLGGKVLLASIVLGTLAEISFSVRRSKDG